MPRRPIGDRLTVSALCFGSMRMTHDRMEEPEAVSLLLSLFDGGVNAVHASSEYDSFPFFTSAFRQARRARPDAAIAAICKIGVPHFGEDRFDPKQFEDKVDSYLGALDIERVDVVQWLLRHDLSNEKRRLAIFDADADLVGATAERLQRAGKIGGLISFPYTRGIGERSLGQEWCSGLALYVNPLERDLADLLDRAAERDKHVIAIRPFAAGRALKPPADLDDRDAEALRLLADCWPGVDSVGRALRHALAHPSVSTAVASVNTPAQADAALAAARAAGPDVERFRRVAGP
jgi:aryl-alcohol dehydrogenase-like predicted oxidoreductase